VWLGRNGGLRDTTATNQLTQSVQGGAVAYLIHDIFKRVWAVDGEADEEEICFGIGKWSETIILLLTCCIPQGQLDGLPRWVV